MESSNILAEAAAQAMQYATIRTWSMTHRSADRVENNKISASLKVGEIKLLLVEIPAASKDLPPDKMTHFLRLVSRWVEAAKPHLQHGTVVAIIGTFSKHWQEPVLKDTVASNVLHQTYHRCCHFGLKIGDQDQPSSACFVVASNVKIESHPCRCKQRGADTHCMDWHAQHSNHRKTAAKKEMIDQSMGNQNHSLDQYN